MARSRSRSPRERGRQYSRSPDGRDYRDYRKGRHGDEGDRYRESDGRDYGRREHDSRRPDYRSRREESDRFGRRDERSSRSHGEPSSRPREDRRDWRDRDARRDWRDGARAREDGSPRPRWRRSNDGDPPDLAQTGRPSPRRDAPGPAAASQQDPKQPPLSLEELLKRRQAEQATAARPVFLSAEQRAEQALARRREEADAQRARVAVAREEAAREARRDGEGETRSFSNGTVAGGESEAERAALLDSIKQQYLGGRAEKKRPVKASERFKFVFDWDASEDTSRDANPLYARQQEAALLFGRGFRAGVDRREQRRAAAAGESALQERRRGRGEAGEDAGEERGGVEGSGYERGDMAASAHWSGKTLAEMTERDWRIFREDFSISYKGSHAAPPLRSWSEAVLPESLLRAVEAAGYVTPSPIQRAAIPLGLAQRDVIGVAETGSGKTCAFVLPMLAYVLAQPELAGHPEREAEGPYAVVLAPTRELAQQIEEETKNLARFTPTRVVSVVGGQSIEEQGFALRKGCEVLVATPGRLVDALGRSYAVLNQCNYVVLDEADRMIDLGFEPQVVGVLDAMPASNLKPEADDAPLERDRVYRTTYMFSATMPPAVERLARSYLRRPVVVTIGRAGKATENVQQHVLVCKENEKAGLLEQQLGKLEDDARVIVFVNTKRACDAVAKQLAELDFRATLLHGGKTQDQREDSIRGFREDRFNVLVATDVAGRGIDVPNVALVVNYDMPHTIEYYTHRIGRTGRAGRKGVAVTFLTLGDTDVYYDLRKFLEDNGVQVPRALAQHEASKNKPGALGGPPRRDAIQYAKK